MSNQSLDCYQESIPLPVISSEDTIYVLIDTDNNPMTGYSSIGMPIGAEKMVEIKGHYGIITQRVMKEWTGSESSDWEWATDEIIDAAASGSEIELEVVDGKFWIHIVGWNGKDDSTVGEFSPITKDGRYQDSGSNCLFYYRFNGDGTDVCVGAGTMGTNGGASFTGTGKMGNGLEVDGSDQSADVTDSDVGNQMGSTWSIEAWFQTDDVSQGTVISIGDFDTNTNDNDFSIVLASTDEIRVCEDTCGFGNTVTTSGVNLQSDTWYHVAVTHDGSEGVNVFINGQRAAGAGSHYVAVGAISSIDNNDGVIVVGEGDMAADFSGVIDDVRMVNYERGAFAGGIMISKVVPSTDKVTLYNAGSTPYEISGLRLNDGRSGGDPTVCWNAAFSTNTIAAGGTLEVSCDVDADDGLFLQDLDGDNDNSLDSIPDPPGKDWTIDGVCWQATSSGTDSECNTSSDPMIAAGVWAEDVYMDMSHGDGDTLYLITNGNNDEGADDWYVPEFSTLLMPIASVLLIVGYSYRRRKALD